MFLSVNHRLIIFTFITYYSSPYKVCDAVNMASAVIFGILKYYGLRNLGDAFVKKKMFNSDYRLVMGNKQLSPVLKIRHFIDPSINTDIFSQQSLSVFNKVTYFHLRSIIITVPVRRLFPSNINFSHFAGNCSNDG